jgi:broad specificity phosphatase PhoE
MAQKTELWLVRHGETAWALSGQHTGLTDIPLTDRGRERALGIRDYLKHRQFKKVLVSPLGRARETCDIAGYGDQAEVDSNLLEWKDNARNPAGLSRLAHLEWARSEW